MKFTDFKKKYTCMGIFSLSDIYLLDAKFDRKQLSRWAKKGDIIKIQKGLYIFSDKEINDFFLYRIANKLTEPSYISLEMALSYYQFIPESVYGITSITAKKTKTVITTIGTFIYRNMKPNLIFGYHLETLNGTTIKLADPEKAILDFLYLTPELNHPNAIKEMRFNRHQIRSIINWEKCNQYLDAFNSKQLNKRYTHFREDILNA